MRKNISAEYIGASAAFGSAVLWASAYVTMKYALATFHPMTMIFLRMAVASVFCLLLIPIVKIRINYQKGDWRIFLLMALAEPCLYFVFEGYALRYTSASQAGMLVSILPVLVGISAFFLLKEKMDKRAWLGCALAIAGVICLSAGAVADEHAPNPILGNFLEFCAMLLATVYAISSRRLSRGYSPFFITAVQAWIGCIFFLPSLFIPGMGIPAEVSTEAWLSILYLGVAISFGAYGLYNFSLGKLQAGKASMYLNLIPVFTLVMGFLLLGEVLTPIQYLASGLVLLGVLISQKGQKKILPAADGAV